MSYYSVVPLVTVQGCISSESNTIALALLLGPILFHACTTCLLVMLVVKGKIVEGEHRFFKSEQNLTVPGWGAYRKRI